MDVSTNSSVGYIPLNNHRRCCKPSIKCTYTILWLLNILSLAFQIVCVWLWLPSPLSILMCITNAVGLIFSFGFVYYPQKAVWKSIYTSIVLVVFTAVSVLTMIVVIVVVVTVDLEEVVGEWIDDCQESVKGVM